VVFGSGREIGGVRGGSGLVGGDRRFGGRFGCPPNLLYAVLPSGAMGEVNSCRKKVGHISY